MTAYLLVDLDVFDPAGYGEYPPKVWPLIEKHGGKLTHRISEFESMEGDWAPSLRRPPVLFRHLATARLPEVV